VWTAVSTSDTVTCGAEYARDGGVGQEGVTRILSVSEGCTIRTWDVGGFVAGRQASSGERLCARKGMQERSTVKVVVCVEREGWRLNG
jgi:hypothetical protein